MTNKLIMTSCLMAIVTTSIFAEETLNPTDQAVQKAMASMFRDIDTNNDMKINQEELSVKGVKLTKFKKADIDSDGSLNEDEFVAYSKEDK